MQIRGIDIKNFRGFDALKVNDFGRLNLIIGKNNAGKTAFLESLVLSVASTYPQAIFNLNNIRENHERDLASLQSFFYNLSFANSPTIVSEWITETGEATQRRVEIAAGENLNYTLKGSYPNERKHDILTTGTLDSRVNQISIITHLETNRTITVSVQFSIGGDEATVTTSQSVDASHVVIFLPSTITQEPMLKRVGYLKENRLEGPLVEILNKLDGRIKKVEVIGDRILLDLENVPKLMPFGLMGDGIKKIMSIMASVIDTDSSTLILVDEIENGLHYSAHVELWRALITMLQTTKAQLFATTHSEETLRYLYKALDDFPEFKSEVRCFDLANTKLKGFQAYKYTYEGLAGAIENETEIRR